MKKILLLTLLSFSFLQAQYTTPNDGGTYTLADLAAVEDGAVEMVSENTYQITSNLTISEDDTFQIVETSTVYINEGVLITVFGTFNTLTNGDDILITLANGGLPYAGFRLEEGSNISLNNTIFEYGGGFKVLTENFIMDECTVRYMVEGEATGAALSFSRGRPIISNSTIYMNDLPAIAAGANQLVAPRILNNTIEMNGQANENRPQINLSASGSQDTINIVNNRIIGDRTKDLVGGIAIANFFGNPNNVNIENNEIKDNRYGMAIFGNNEYAMVKGNLIENNDSQNQPLQGGSGINLYTTGSEISTNVIIRENTISGNLWGITLQVNAYANIGDGTEDSPGLNTFSNNGNGGNIYALYNNTNHALFAQNNCWIAGQESTTEEVENVIFHEVDDSTLGLVNFANFECNLSVADISTENQIKLYPNPTKDFLNIDIQEDGTLQIYNTNGKLVLTKALHSGNNQVALRLEKGVYFVQIQQGKNVYSDKLIIK